MAQRNDATGWSKYLNYQAVKDGMKKYGRTGVVVYLTLSTCVTGAFYVAIERNVDVEAMLGLKKHDPASTEPPSFVERVLLGKGSHLALAFVCSKMLVPIKLPIALAITPYFHRLQQRLLGGISKAP